MNVKCVLFYLLLIAILSITNGTGQIVSSNGFHIPYSIHDSNQQFDLLFTKKAKRQLSNVEKIHTISERQLNVDLDYIFDEWLPEESTSMLSLFFLEKDIVKKIEQEYLLITAYHSFLKKKEFHLEEEIAKLHFKRDSIQRMEDSLYKIRSTADSIDIQYIPKNLEDSYHQLDLLLEHPNLSEIKDQLRQDVLELSFGFDRYLRNIWGLWGGSRLKEFFKQHGVQHADEMSSLILAGYHAYLNGKPSDLVSVIEYAKQNAPIQVPPLATIQFVRPREIRKSRRLHERLIKHKKIKSIRINQ